MMTYQELKAAHQKRIDDFPMGFAFSDKQLEEVIKELGPLDTLINIGGGAILRKKDCDKFDRLFADCEAEMNHAMEDDDFLQDAIRYELNNHEYCITHDPDSTIEALGIDIRQPRIRQIFNKAKTEYLSHVTL